MHPAFNKAAHYFDLKMVLVPVDANGQVGGARLPSRHVPFPPTGPCLPCSHVVCVCVGRGGGVSDAMPCAQADVAEVAKAINRNTVLLVASAPQYPHGVVDPIDAIGELAVAHRKPGC